MVKKQNKVNWLTWLLAVIAIVALVLAIVAINKVNMTGNSFISDLFSGKKKLEAKAQEQIQTQTSEGLGMLGDAYVAAGGDKANLANYEVKYGEKGDLIYQISSEGFFGTEEGFILSGLGTGNQEVPGGDCECGGTECLTGCNQACTSTCNCCVCKDLEFSKPENTVYKNFQCYEGGSAGNTGIGTD